MGCVYMINYDELYELLRKEKYSEVLQELPKNFVEDFAKYLSERRNQEANEEHKEGLFEQGIGANKEIENALTMFKELILRRKKKILNLVFVAGETGIMKRDYEYMLGFEKEIFDKFVKIVEEGDKEISKLLHGRKEEKEGDSGKLIMFNQDVEEFVDMEGNAVGPFGAGELVNFSTPIANILVEGGKASFVDES